MTSHVIHIDMNGEEAEQELRSFYRWLQDDEDIRRYARVSLRPSSPKEGEMGSALEVIELVLSNGFETASLTFTYLSWRLTRKEKPKVTIKRGDIEIIVAADDEKTMKNIIRALSGDSE